MYVGALVNAEIGVRLRAMRTNSVRALGTCGEEVCMEKESVACFGVLICWLSRRGWDNVGVESLVILHGFKSSVGCIHKAQPILK